MSQDESPEDRNSMAQAVHCTGHSTIPGFVALQGGTSMPCAPPTAPSCTHWYQMISVTNRYQEFRNEVGLFYTKQHVYIMCTGHILAIWRGFPLGIYVCVRVYINGMYIYIYIYTALYIAYVRCQDFTLALPVRIL